MGIGASVSPTGDAERTRSVRMLAVSARLALPDPPADIRTDGKR
jgi:hypothetical protein